MQYTIEQEQYIEHEVKLRVHDEKFKILEKDIKRLDNKINAILGLVISGIILPILLKWVGWV